MPKPIVFISHITPEREVAVAFKELIESSFLGMMEVFVSSDENSIGMGNRWLDDITGALQNCAVEIILCSPKSVQRPWINFEAGAGWIREIPVIPLCHSGMEPSKLPIPLNLLQAANAGEVSSLNLVFPVLAQAIGAKTPKTDFSGFVTQVKEFEQRYTFWDQCNATFTQLNAFQRGLVESLGCGVPVTIPLTETQINKLEQVAPWLEQQNLLKFSRVGGVSVESRGTFYRIMIQPLSKLSEVLSSPNFIHRLV